MKIIHSFFNPIHYTYFLDKYEDLPITLFMDKMPEEGELELNPYNIMLLHEPNSLFNIHDTVYQNSELFDIILTSNPMLLDILSNSILFTFGLVHTNDKDYYNSFNNKEKQFEISYVSGTKSITEGHKLRQSVFKLENDIIIPKNWNYVLDDYDHVNKVRPGYTEYSKNTSHIPEDEAPEHYGKRKLFSDSMFHVSIENTNTPNFYGEKITQAFATKTIPLYWGCPNLGDLGYDERGIIRFNNSNDLLDIINNLTPEDYYSRIPYIEHNYKLALQDTFRTKLDTFLTELKSLNNL
jgi:hypothetical protein